MNLNTKPIILDNKICLVVVYIGELPLWFPAFQTSCEYNPNIDWIIFTNASKLPEKQIKNLRFHSMNLEAFIKKASLAMNTTIKFNNRKKLCDFKPIYGAIFNEELNGYKYWGHCDLDIVWGDIESFLKKINFIEYDIISTRRLTICGHFTLYRNVEKINNLYACVKNYQKIYTDEVHYGFDEGYFSYYLYQEMLNNPDFEPKIYWPKKYSADWPELRRKPNGWFWSNGKIHQRNGIEKIYIHFMEWKKTVTTIDFDFDDNPSKFAITKYGIWSKPMDLTNRLKLLFPKRLSSVLKYNMRRVSYAFKYKILNKPLPEVTPNIREGFKVIE